jgi:hypothetical protein
MIKDDTVTFTDEIANSVSMDFELNEPIKLDYTDPEAVELEMDLDLRLKDSAGNLWTIAPEDQFPIIHLLREDGA